RLRFPRDMQIESAAKLRGPRLVFDQSAVTGPLRQPAGRRVTGPRGPTLPTNAIRDRTHERAPTGPMHPKQMGTLGRLCRACRIDDSPPLATAAGDDFALSDRGDFTIMNLYQP